MHDLPEKPWSPVEQAAEGALLLMLLAAAAALLYVPRETVPLDFDCAAYAAQSLNIARGLGNTMRFGGEEIPGFYPVGYPALTALCHFFLGAHLQNGVYVNLFLALLTLVATWWIARTTGGAAAGILAFLFLLESFVFRHVARRIYSQVPSLFCVAVAAALLVAAVRARKRGPALFLIGAAGVVTGLSVFVRANNLVLVAAAGLYPLLGFPAPAAGKRGAAAALWAGLAASALTVGLYNLVCYGSPLATGYTLWGFEAARMFSLDYVFHPPVVQMDPNHTLPLVRWLCGNGFLYGWPVALCALGGTVEAFLSRRAGEGAHFRRLVLFFLLSTFFLYPFLAVYFFRSPIYAMLTVPLVAAVAAAGLARILRRLPAARPAWRRVLLWMPVLAAAGALAPLFGEAYLLNPGATRPRGDVRILEEAGARVEENAVLVGAPNPILTEYLFVGDTPRKYLFVNRRRGAQFQRLVEKELGPGRLTLDKVEGWVRRARAEGRPVYFLLYPFMPNEGALLQETFRHLKKRFRMEETGMPALRRIVPKTSRPPPERNR